MTDEHNTPNNTPQDIPAGEQTEDIIPERKIRTADAVHTGAGTGKVYIPETPDETPPADGPRFIKTDGPEVIRVREDAPGEDGTAVSDFADRFAPPKPAADPAPERPAKPGGYDAAHTPAEGERQIDTPAADAQLKMKGADAPVRILDEPDDELPLNPDGTADPGAGAPDPSDGGTRPFDIQGSRLREIAGTADDGVRRNPDQMMMEGFEEIGRKTEEELEEETAIKDKLRQSRERLVRNFRFWNKAPDETGGQTTDEAFTEHQKRTVLPAFAAKFSARFEHIPKPFIPIRCEEYTDEGDRKKTLDTIKRARMRSLIGVCVLGAFALILLITDLAAKLTAGNNGGFFTVLGGNVNALVTFNLVFLVLACGVMLPDLKNGVIAMLQCHFKTDSMLVLVMFAALLQTALSFVTQLKISWDYQLLAPAAVIVSIPILAAKIFYYDNARQCFKTVSARSEKSYLRKVTDPELKARLGAAEDGNTVYAGKTRAISGFPASAQDGARGEMLSSKLCAVLAAASLLTGLIVIIIKKSFMCGLSAFTLCLTLALPVCCLISGGFFLARVNGKLSIKSSFIQSFGAAKAFSAIDEIACDASQIFTGTITNCLTAKGVSEKQVRFAAAAVAVGAGSLMKKIFADDIETYSDKLPPAQNTVYEDRLGVSSYVGGCTVLLGNHDLLVNHNVAMPAEDVVMRFLAEGEKPLYLAMEGRFTALFAVKYAASDEVKHGMKALVNSGAALLLGTTDPNITDGYAEELLDLGENSVRMIGSAALRRLSESQAAVADAEDAGVVFTDSFVSLSRVAAQATRLISINTVCYAVCAAGAFASLLVGMILGLTGAFSSATALPVLLLHCVWIGCCFLSPMFTASLLGFIKKITGVKNGIAGKMRAKPAAAAAPDAAAPKETPDGEDAETPAEDTPIFEEDDEPFYPETLTPAEDEDVPPPSEEELAEVLGSLDTFAPRDAAPQKDAAPADEAGAAPRFIASGKLRETFSSVGEFYDELTADQPHAAEDGTPDDFSLYGDAPAEGRKKAPRKKDADEIEREYEEGKKRERRLRKAFTAPETPAPPVPEPTPAPEPPADEEEPLDTSDVNVYNDELFRRFEDDSVFAGLHEDEDGDGDGGDPANGGAYDFS